MSVVLTSSRAVFIAALAAIGVWLFWYGQWAWQGPQCKRMRAAARHGPPASLVLSASCALRTSSPVFIANVAFFFAAPAVAALSALAWIALKQQQVAASAPAGPPRDSRLTAGLRHILHIQLPPQRLWQWLLDGLSVRDALVIAVWAAYNAVWYSTILGKGLSYLPPGMVPPVRLLAKGLGSLSVPSIVLLFFPVSRGSVVNQALGLSFTDGIRFHRMLGQWVLLLIQLHGLMYWISWAMEGLWLSALRQGDDTNNLMGSIGLVFAMVLWLSSQEPIRRRWFAVFKALHHLAFWGFLLAGVAHHWSLFWAFVPGLLLYAVDGVFRLHQMLLGRGLDARNSAAGPSPPATGIITATELLAAEVDDARSCVSLLLSAPAFGVPPVGAVWLSAPGISKNQWHPFDCTSVKLAPSSGGAAPRMALMCNIKAYDRWTRALVDRVAAGDRVALEVQGPYSDPYLSSARAIDAIIVIAGGNGIAAVLSAFQELAAAGVNTQGMPALLVWTARHGHEMTFTGPRVMAAAKALGLQLTCHLHVTAPKSILAAGSTEACDIKASSDQTHPSGLDTVDVTFGGSSSTSSSGDGSDAGGSPRPSFVAQDGCPAAGMAAANSLCPVVAFATFVGQLGFRAAMHAAVFGGALAGFFLARYFSAVRPVAAGLEPWGTRDMGLLMVALTVTGALGTGLVTLWAGLLLAVRLTAMTAASPPAGTNGDKLRRANAVMPSAAVLPLLGARGRLVVAAGSTGGKGAINSPHEAPALELLLPTSAAGDAPEERYPVRAGRPGIEALVSSWLGGLAQLPAGSAHGAVDVTVFGCGPTPLIHSTQALVQALNAKQRCRRQAGGGARVRLHFERKTQAL